MTPLPQTWLGAQRELEGVAALQLPSHCTVPLLVMPQLLGELLQLLPVLGTHEGGQSELEGVVALQLPLHWIVPPLVIPHVLGDD